MSNHLSDVLKRIGEDYKDNISKKSRFYREVDIGRQAEMLGYADLRKKYEGKYAIIPLRKPVNGMKVRIDGRTFVDYAQFDSGVVVAGYIAREAGMPYKTFLAQDSMIRNFAEA
jgi:hypothetical protein